MEISAVLLARTIAFFETVDLNPRGNVFLPNVVSLLAARFGFQKLPDKILSENDKDDKSEKGIKFENGYFSGTTVDKLTIFSDGVTVDLRSSTKDGELIIEDTLGWLNKEVGLVYRPNMISRWGYVSQLTFWSDVDLLKTNKALELLQQRLTSSVSEHLGADYSYHPTAVALDFDRTTHKEPLIRFSIQRRSEAAFAANKYYSEAPLETEKHIELLELFEAEVKEL